MTSLDFICLSRSKALLDPVVPAASSPAGFERSFGLLMETDQKCLYEYE